MKIRILVADDHPVVLKGLAFFLGTHPDFELVGQAHDGNEVLEKVEELRPDVVLMDLLMPVVDGVEATARIKTGHPAVKVVVLTSFADFDHILPALRAGATGYILKDVHPDQLAEAIRGAYNGNVLLSPDISTNLMERVASLSAPSADPAPPEGLDRLTGREREVLAAVAQGMSNKEIATLLHISEKTVKSHMTRILGKLELNDRTQAALYAVKGRDGN